ncbi:MAG TPA: YigZ family protein [Clostridiales bacterium]|nr:MAG: YigZ family protein [Clostridiales bacterium GWD2_32_19]HCC07834.1 YigZ family protein [Clostridiales bacterium]
MIKEYNTIKNEVSAQIQEKKSVFIANIRDVLCESEAKEFINQVCKKHNDARHNVPVYRILHEDKIVESFSDNGEPKGSAGMPILEILRGRNLVNICVVVTRYFGGTLLGTGGLLRAYSDAAREGILACELITKKVYDKYHLSCEYSDLEKIKHKLSQSNIKYENIIYTDKINMDIFAGITDFVQDIVKMLNEETNNNFELNLVNKNIYK